MALVAIEEAFDGEVDAANSRYTFLGRSNDLNDSIESIKASPLCPREGDVDRYNDRKQISNVQVRRASTETKSLAWVIHVTSVLLVLPTENPLLILAAITLQSEQFEFLTCFDKDGKGILNRAKSLVYVPREATRWIFNVKKNVPNIPAFILTYANATNNGSITVAGLPCDKGTLMLKNLQGGEQQTVQVGLTLVNFLPMSFQLHYREEGWKAPYPNVGFDAYYDDEPILQYVLGPSGRRTNKVKTHPVLGWPVTIRGKVRRRITLGAFGETAITEPQILNDEGYVVENPTPGDLIKLKAEVYAERDFNLLPLT